MLSRVAAVKAPRKHNRCRVTGSSVRRREGRESEPQRPNMSRHLFYSALLLLLFVMMCCNAGVAAEAEEHSSESKVKWKDIKDEEGGVTVESLGAPGLLNVGSDVFAVAEAQCKKKGESKSFTGIASQIITIDNANTPVEVLKDPKDTQFLEDGSADLKKKVDVSRPTTILKENDIYMLAGKYSRTSVRGAQGSGGGADDGGLLLVKGEVCEENGSGKRIKWSDDNAVPRPTVGELDSWTGLIGGGGSGVKMEDGTLVFPVEGTNQVDTENDVKTVSLVIYSLDANSWKLSKGMSADGCSDPSVVEWRKKDKKLMMMTACGDGRRRVYESGDKGESWTEALGTLSRVWGNKKDGEVKAVRSGFITATVGDDNKKVMLVTLPVYAKNGEGKGHEKNENGKLHLWLTDNTHIVDIGSVSDDDAAASSLLYKSAGIGDKKEELIALYEKKKDDADTASLGMVSVLLTEQLQRVKEVLKTWKKVDDIVSQLCTNSITQDVTSPDGACTAVKITDGLVGFLSGKFSENTWSDEYLGVNATVKENGGGAAAATGYAEKGVTLRGAWAEWPVGEQGENQLYHFANYNFTLVATVSIHKVQEEFSPIPLMGVKMNDSGKTVLLGLSYNKEKKWQLLCSGGPIKELSSTWEPEETHQLAIVLQNGTHGSAYVDDRRVGGNEACALGNKDSEAISHFYIGGDGEKTRSQGDVSVTVTNVLLYNRPLDDEEIAALTKNKITNPKPEVPKTSTTSPLSPAVSGSDVQGTVPLSNSARQPPSEQGQPKGSIGAGAGGASAPATSTAADSSSDGDPRVGAEAGGAMQGDTPPQTPVDNPDKADANAPIATEVAQVDPADTTEVSVSSGEDGEPTEGRDGQGELHPRDRGVNATALSSSLGNVSQENNSDGGTVSESRMLPSLLLLLLGLWGLAAL
ncbi:trans-sialidase [Trypanosoma cruzi cruzi]|uniref:Putative trans-sialidase, Group V n=1 Tax=Trypanosoma cruzi TaxID=5693 RepID=A0A2V2VDA0_TRYCR|nr:trans-sialidase [Trypanosoma cruzi cruzi]PWU93078.1 putative trans-sialidase, Group V [Trypanosoma cruzi]